ncbi:ferritin-like domain-containing protein [Campylobacter concisus]|uniref:ferritin-like domain-containing protein n=1 Tax=Campylobacter concisus TaxID=199 RepID=UPI0018AC4D60|nr:ferritin-like domain-containing protein [Campylobacter concisus]QPH99579.1 ferritin-like domain-containing protein [Campylobacter concisus]QPI01375.1 ferritin-like domain-containing protein [Campylobacter concisus]
MLNELLNASYTSEKNALSLYENLALFGDVFNEIANIRKNAIILIEKFASTHDYELACENEAIFLPAKNKEDALIQALNYELELNKMYEKFCESLDDEELKDLFFRLWATSNNEYITSLKQRLKEIYSGCEIKNELNLNEISQNFEQNGITNILENYQNDFNEITKSLQNIASGKADKSELAKITNNPNFSFFSGLALGALGISVVSKNFNKDEENE